MRQTGLLSCQRNEAGKIFFLTFLCMLVSVSAFAGMEVQGGAPAGFEQLDTPRPTSVKLYYGGEFLGDFPAHFTPSSLQFDKPEDIVKAVPTIINAGRVQAALKQPMPTNARLWCGEKPKDGCGILQPEIAGVIFDESNLRAELFIRKNYLSVSENKERFLPLPDRHLSSVYSFNGAVSGTGVNNPNFAISNDAIYSYGEIQYNTQSTVTNEGLRFDKAAASIERNGWNATGGMFRSRAMQLLSDRDIAGVSVSTSSRTILDSRKTEGNDVLVYLPRRSFVSIYREGRLYSSKAYEAGNQMIDTSELPEGAYTITLKIQEADGATREETRFFAKTQFLPPPDRPVYYAQAGFVRKNSGNDSTVPEFTGDPIIRLGTVRRIDDNLGLNISLLGTSDRAIMENGIFWLNGKSQLRTTLLSSTKGDLGIQATYLQKLGSLNASIDLRRLWMQDSPIAGFGDMPNDLMQGSATISYAFTPNIYGGARANYAKDSNSSTTMSFGPYAEWRIWQKGESIFNLSADAARNNGMNEGSILLRFSHRFGNYGVTGSAGGSYNAQGGGPTGNARVWHQQDDPGNKLLLGAGVSADTRQQVVSGDADWQNKVGQLHGSVQQAATTDGNHFGYGGNFSVNASQLGNDISFGGDQNDKSAVIIAVNGDANTEMKIFVNNVERSHVATGHQQTIYLTPFQNYNIRVAPAVSTLLDYDSSDRKITVYPGNVVKQNWNVNKFYVVSARIVKIDGTPLVNALLKESHTQISTDDKGRIQTELSTPQILTFDLGNQNTCHVTLPVIKEINGVLLYRDALACVN